MNIFTLTAVEFKKIRRSKILLIMIAATVILWLPNVLNADLNFDMSDIGISPEDSFFIQGFMGMAWFIYPMGYPFYLIMSEYGEVAENIGKNTVDLIPWIPVAVCISLFCLLISCLCFGRNERR